MQDASTFWEKVHIRSKELGINQIKLCKICGMNIQTHRNRVSKKQFPSLEDSYSIARALNVSLDYLFSGVESNEIETLQKLRNDDSDVFMIPILNQKLSAGKGELSQEYDLSHGVIKAPSSLKKYGRDISALEVNGDSMEPTISSGDLVICDCCGWDGEGIYALRLNGDAFIKRLSKSSKSLLIISDNPKYPPREEPLESEAIQIIGKIHALIHNLG